VAGDPFFSLKPKRLSDSAVDEILQLIRDGKLELGSKLPSERELITRLKVSRSSLREAIRMLETMGVLVVRPGRGTWIRDDYQQPFSNDWLSWLPSHEKDVMDLLEMRETLEVQAAALAAERATPEQVANMQAQLARMEAMLAKNDLEGLAEADTGLHEAIGEGSGNPILAQTLRSLGLLVADSRRAIWAVPGHPRRSVPEHAKVIQAIAAKDSEGAGKAMFKHVRKAKEDVAGVLKAGISIALGASTDGGNGDKGGGRLNVDGPDQISSTTGS
jgi:GntR family transcriptional regulator, transcriptional repressor for pyruvate dehydrogenase complex